MTHHHSPAPWCAQAADDFQSQMAIAVQLKQKKVTLPKQEWGVVQVCCVCVCAFFFLHISSRRRTSPTGDSDLFAMQTFFVFFQSAKKHVKGEKSKATTNAGDNGKLSSALHTVLVMLLLSMLV